MTDYKPADREWRRISGEEAKTGDALPIPEFIVSYPEERYIDIYYQKPEKKNYNITGVILGYEIRDAPPKNQELFLHSVFSTRSPYRFAFAEEERGRIFYIAIRWLNRQGELGPWSEIQRAVVP